MLYSYTISLKGYIDPLKAFTFSFYLLSKGAPPRAAGGVRVGAAPPDGPRRKQILDFHTNLLKFRGGGGRGGYIVPPFRGPVCLSV